MKEATLAGRGISYRSNEIVQSRQTLVFIHGLSGSLSVWYPFEERFNDLFNVITLDLRGHGLSKKYSNYSDYSLEALADDVYEVVQFLNISSSILVSHSLGGLVALEFIHKYPEQVSKVVFISPPAGANNLFIEHVSHPLRGLGVIGAFLFSKLRAPQGRTDYVKHRGDGDWDLGRIFEDVSNTGRLPYLYALNHLYNFKNEKWWGEIKVPTLIIHGSEDSMVPLSYANDLAKRIPTATFKVFENKNHLLPMNSINELCDEIEEFVK